MNRRGQAVVLLLVGLAVLHTSVTDVYLRFVKSGLQPFLIAAGLLLIATAAMTLWHDERPSPDQDQDHNEDHDEDHGHGHGHEPRVAWLLLLPIAVLALVAPQALGADAAGRAGSALQAPTSDFEPLPDGDPAVIGLQEYASRAVFDNGRTLQNRTVRLLGFVLVGDDGETYLARMIVSCCAADARPIKIGMTGTLPPGLAPDTWLSVTGAYSAKVAQDPVNGATIPFVAVASVERVERPSNPYQV